MVVYLYELLEIPLSKEIKFAFTKEITYPSSWCLSKNTLSPETDEIVSGYSNPQGKSVASNGEHDRKTILID